MPTAADHIAWAVHHLNKAVEFARQDRQAEEFIPTPSTSQLDRRRLQRLSERVGALIAVATLAAELMPPTPNPSEELDDAA